FWHAAAMSAVGGSGRSNVGRGRSSLTQTGSRSRSATTHSATVLLYGSEPGVTWPCGQEVARSDGQGAAMPQISVAEREEEVARLRQELAEASERQSATDEVLRIIASSPADAQHVFDTIVRNFVSLCGSTFGAIYTFDGELVHFAGAHGFSPGQPT